MMVVRCLCESHRQLQSLPTAPRWAAISVGADDAEDGPLGTDEGLVPFTLSPGRQRITLRATDSDGRTGSASVQVVVGYPVYLPAVLKGS